MRTGKKWWRHKGLPDTIHDAVGHKQHSKSRGKAGNQDAGSEEEPSGDNDPFATEKVGRQAGKRDYDAEGKRECTAYKPHGRIRHTVPKRSLNIWKHGSINLSGSLCQKICSRD